LQRVFHLQQVGEERKFLVDALQSLALLDKSFYQLDLIRGGILERVTFQRKGGYSGKLVKMREEKGDFIAYVARFRHCSVVISLIFEKSAGTR